jgi:hypothetical protein
VPSNGIQAERHALVGVRLTAWLMSTVRAPVRACGRTHPSWAREPHAVRAYAVAPVNPTSHQQPGTPTGESPPAYRQAVIYPEFGEAGAHHKLRELRQASLTGRSTRSGWRGPASGGTTVASDDSPDTSVVILTVVPKASATTRRSLQAVGTLPCRCGGMRLWTRRAIHAASIGGDDRS